MIGNLAGHLGIHYYRYEAQKGMYVYICEYVFIRVNMCMYVYSCVYVYTHFSWRFIQHISFRILGYLFIYTYTCTHILYLYTYTLIYVYIGSQTSAGTMIEIPRLLSLLKQAVNAVQIKPTCVRSDVYNITTSTTIGSSIIKKRFRTPFND